MSDTKIDHTSSGTFELPQNYSILINKLEQLALGLDTALGNFTLDRKEVAISLGGATDAGISSEEIIFGVGSPIAAGRAPPPRVITHSLSADTDEYARVVSDIWIGVILTLLIVSVIFFICACFLYHKFQQWKNSYRTNNAGEPLEICRRFPPDYEVESLPSYTIVSGLPTYDDALEEFRKAGIILTPTAVVPIIKIFEADTKDTAPQLYNSAAHCETTFTIANEQQSSLRASNDNISLSSTCTCGAGSLNQQQPPSQLSSGLALNAAALQPQFIELSPEHLAALSQKRLSLQIAFNGSLRRNSRARVDLRNTLLRSRAGNAVAAATAANERATLDAGALLPPIHRSSSVNSLQHERNLLDHRLQHLHHRGSLC